MSYIETLKHALAYVDAAFARRKWLELPQSFEFEAVNHLKQAELRTWLKLDSHFKKDVSAKVALSRATTFAELETCLKKALARAEKNAGVR